MEEEVGGAEQEAGGDKQHQVQGVTHTHLLFTLSCTSVICPSGDLIPLNRSLEQGFGSLSRDFFCLSIAFVRASSARAGALSAQDLKGPHLPKQVACQRQLKPCLSQQGLCPPKQGLCLPEQGVYLPEQGPFLPEQKPSQPKQGLFYLTLAYLLSTFCVQ